MADNTKKDDELLPCPFCGGEAKFIPDNIYSNDPRRIHASWVECSKCGAEGSHVVDRLNNNCRKEAKSKWNTRMPILKIDGIEEEVKNFIEGIIMRHQIPEKE